MSNVLKFVFLLCALFIIAKSDSSFAAEKAPPGSSWFIHDSAGWSGTLQRVGTTGTMWGRSTVPFTGDFSAVGKHSVASDIDVHISVDGALFMIRNDRSAQRDSPERSCTYQGQADPPPKSLKRAGAFMYRFKLEGTFLCSDMDSFGTWFGEMNW